VKYAFTSFSRPRDSLQELIVVAKEFGYAAIEPRAESGHAHGVELDASAAQRRQIRDTCQSENVRICCIGTGCRLAFAQCFDQFELAKRYIYLAADVGSPLIRVFAGALADTDIVDVQSKHLIDSLRELAGYAVQQNVTVCLETHDSHCDPHRVARIMREVDFAGVGVVWDIMHTQRQGKTSMAESHAILAPWIRHVHIHDGLDTLEQLRMRPIGEGAFDHRAVLRLLRQSNYGGYISGEWISGCMDDAFFASHLGREIATLRRYEMELT
jgi:sugar phosphate isomerase/epimerase